MQHKAVATKCCPSLHWFRIKKKKLLFSCNTQGLLHAFQRNLSLKLYFSRCRWTNNDDKDYNERSTFSFHVEFQCSYPTAYFWWKVPGAWFSMNWNQILSIVIGVLVQSKWLRFHNSYCHSTIHVQSYCEHIFFPRSGNFKTKLKLTH